MAKKTLTEQEALSEQRGRETTNAWGMNKERRNWQNLTDVEEEIDESINHKNKETMKEKAGVTEKMLEKPKAKTNLLDGHSEFMRQMDERLHNKINEILNMTPTKKAIKEAKEQ